MTRVTISIRSDSLGDVHVETQRPEFLANPHEEVTAALEEALAKVRRAYQLKE